MHSSTFSPIQQGEVTHLLFSKTQETPPSLAPAAVRQLYRLKSKSHLSLSLDTYQLLKSENKESTTYWMFCVWQKLGLKNLIPLPRHYEEEHCSGFQCCYWSCWGLYEHIHLIHLTLLLHSPSPTLVPNLALSNFSI